MKLENRYFSMRHGKSNANLKGIIVSHPLYGIGNEFTLSETGEEQVRQSAFKARAEGLLDAGTFIFSSLFSRAKKTAEIVKEVLEIQSQICFDNRLRERWFGQLEGKSNSNYQKVWDRDIQNGDCQDFGVESASQVQSRVKSLIDELENNHSDKKILLVSHGDVLQILQTVFLKKSARKHRQVPHLELAEIRELIYSTIL